MTGQISRVLFPFPSHPGDVSLSFFSQKPRNYRYSLLTYVHIHHSCESISIYSSASAFIVTSGIFICEVVCLRTSHNIYNSINRSDMHVHGTHRYWNIV